MKILSVAIPCYNSASYMDHCINTLLSGGNDVEIIIVNDGSTKDNTLEIAREFEAKYPDIIKVVDKPNGGHGSAVNSGIKNATGKYFKVVDSDDWVGEAELLKIIAKLKELDAAGTAPDMLLSNFIYDKQGQKNKKVMSYKGTVPTDKLITWDDVGRFPKGKYILMHSIMYKTEVLRECKLELPEHTFYVDNLFAFIPYPFVKTIYYMDIPLYHYFIGRDDQSVNEKVMISRIDQQLKVNYIMADEFRNYREKLTGQKKLSDSMYNYLEIITVISSILCLLSKNEENIQKKNALWKHIEEIDPETYKRMNSGLYRHFNRNNKFENAICIAGYKLAQKLFGFN